MSESHSVVPDSLRPHGLYSPWNSLGQNTGMGSLSPASADLPNPGIKPRSPALQADSLPAEPQEKPKNTGVGSLSLLQQIFLTRESNWALLHCRRILYQLRTFPNCTLHLHGESLSTRHPWGCDPFAGWCSFDQEVLTYLSKAESDSLAEMVSLGKI